MSPPLLEEAFVSRLTFTLWQYKRKGWEIKAVDFYYYLEMIHPSIIVCIQLTLKLEFMITSAFTCVKIKVITTFTAICAGCVCTVKGVEYHLHPIICAASL